MIGTVITYVLWGVVAMGVSTFLILAAFLPTNLPPE